jgi:hypothetical protein
MGLHLSVEILTLIGRRRRLPGVLSPMVPGNQLRCSLAMAAALGGCSREFASRGKPTAGRRLCGMSRVQTMTVYLRCCSIEGRKTTVNRASGSCAAIWAAGESANRIRPRNRNHIECSIFVTGIFGLLSFLHDPSVERLKGPHVVRIKLGEGVDLLRRDAERSLQHKPGDALSTGRSS